uniref:Uncharacterized protein n=1 Tax=Craspedostauros australis TaxID=1486917 RepID=A0A7R9ZIH5_9STRA|mmetsp:Transcript_10910/g.30115  ORF Transcript_10910/g.30115 Transcript_10910/m.30115 type:complete len:280 (+) Transcript_10910:150-989(+)
MTQNKSHRKGSGFSFCSCSSADVCALVSPTVLAAPPCRRPPPALVAAGVGTKNKKENKSTESSSSNNRERERKKYREDPLSDHIAQGDPKSGIENDGSSWNDNDNNDSKTKAVTIMLTRTKNPTVSVTMMLLFMTMASIGVCSSFTTVATKGSRLDAILNVPSRAHINRDRCNHEIHAGQTVTRLASWSLPAVVPNNGSSDDLENVTDPDSGTATTMKSLTANTFAAAAMATFLITKLTIVLLLKFVTDLFVYPAFYLFRGLKALQTKIAAKWKPTEQP